jgi:hypothetical protein
VGDVEGSRRIDIAVSRGGLLELGDKVERGGDCRSEGVGVCHW